MSDSYEFLKKQKDAILTRHNERQQAVLEAAREMRLRLESTSRDNHRRATKGQASEGRKWEECDAEGCRADRAAIARFDAAMKEGR